MCIYIIMSSLTLNGGIMDGTNSNLNINKSNILLTQNYGINGGITDISSNMFTITNSSINITNPISISNAYLGLNNTWSGTNTFNGDISINNTNTVINSTGIVNISGVQVNLAGMTSVNKNLLLSGTDGVNYLQFPNGSKQYVASANYLSSNNTWSGTNTFNADISINNTNTVIKSTGVIGISGGIVNISGGTINIDAGGSGNLNINGLGTATTTRQLYINDSTGLITKGAAASSYSSITQLNSNIGIGNTNPLYALDVSGSVNIKNSTGLIGLSGGIVNISGGKVNIAGDNINLCNSLITSSLTSYYSQIFTYTDPSNTGGNGIVSTISPNGNMIALSNPKNSILKVYSLNNTSGLWSQLGQTITNTNGGDLNDMGGFGTNVQFSQNGIMVVAAPFEGTTFPSTGVIYIYYYNTSTSQWTIINVDNENGSNLLSIYDQVPGSYNGFALAISNDGSTLAFGSNNFNNVKIYTYNLSTNKYVRVLSSTYTASTSSTSVALSDNGSVLAVGDQIGGKANIYRQTNDTTWNLNSSMDVLSPGGSAAGGCVCLSGDGNILAISSLGSTYIYKYNGSSWGTPNIVSNNISGSDGVDRKLMELSKDGTKLFMCGNVSNYSAFLYYENSGNVYVSKTFSAVSTDLKVTAVSMSYDGTKFSLGDTTYNSNNGKTSIYSLVSGNTLAINGGNVGIGTTAPAYNLDVVGNANVSGSFNSLMYITIKKFSFNSMIGTPSTSQFIGKIINGGLVTVYIKSSGYDHGEGTIAEIFCGYGYAPTARIVSPRLTSYRFYYVLSGGTTYLWFNEYSNSAYTKMDYECRIYCNNPLNFYPNTTDGNLPSSSTEITKGQFMTGNEGYVGIGTTNPQKKLHVSNANGGGVGSFSTTGIESAWIDFYNQNNGRLVVGVDGIGLAGIQTNAGVVGTWTSYPLILATNQTEKMRITSGGNVGIGNTNPAYKLDVAGTANFSGTVTCGGVTCGGGISFLRPDNNTNTAFNVGTNTDGHYIGYGGNAQNMRFFTGTTERMTLKSNGYVGIGNSNPNYPLHITTQVNYGDQTGYLFNNAGTGVNTAARPEDFVSVYGLGKFMSSGGYIAVSDSRIKNNIVDIDDNNALSILRKIQPKTYDYIDKIKKGNGNVIGFIAQEIKAIIPKAVTITKDCIPNFYTVCQVAPTDVPNIVLVTSPIDLSWNPLHGSANASNASDPSGNAFIDAEGNSCSDASGNKCFNVKLYDQSNNEIKCKTTNVLDKRSFLMDISGSKMLDGSGNILLEKDGGYFLHGQEVDDFHNIDKSAIFTVVTAAVQDIDRIQQAQQVSQTQIQETQSQIQSQQQADAEKISVLEQHIITLQNETTSLKNETTSLKNETTSLQNETTSLQNETTSLKNETTSLKNDNATLTGEVATLTSQLSTLKTQMDAVLLKLNL
jgi:hypothetical protein